MEIRLKPITVNKCWQGRRFKTPEYETWREAFGYLITTDEGYVEEDGELEVWLKFYLKHYSTTDVDNLVKPTLDALQENGVIENDRFIKRIVAEKFHSKDERIEINIIPLNLL